MTKKGLKGLAAEIARGLLAERPKRAPTPECFACGRTYVPKPMGGDDRFCSDRCREAYDAGFPPYDPTYHLKSNPRWYSLPMGKHGFLIECHGCGRTFDSKGLRCCSTKCERGLGEKREIKKLKAEAGVEFVSKMGPKRKCEREGCGRDIPRWRGGKRVSARARFCDECSGRKVPPKAAFGLR
jgi:predicted nucleic acid-binding Zn ribbon protein